MTEQTNGSEPPQAEPTVDEQVGMFIEVRDVLKLLEDEYNEKRKPLLEIQDRIEGWLQKFMEKSGSEGIKTKHGTCYSSTRYRASLADPEAFMRFVIEHEKYELLDRRANSTAVKAYVQENSTLPPGCNLNAIKSVNVRRK